MRRRGSLTTLLSRLQKTHPAEHVDAPNLAKHKPMQVIAGHYDLGPAVSLCIIQRDIRRRNKGTRTEFSLVAQVRLRCWQRKSSLQLMDAGS